MPISLRTTSLFLFITGWTLLGFGVGCEKQKVQQPTGKASPWMKDHWSPVKPAQTQAGRVDPRYGRKGRRISVSHLKTIIPKLFPGLHWTDYRKQKMFERLSRTLGQADYIYQTQSHRVPTPLFMKFMDDMAGQLCKKAAAADAKNKDENSRMLIRYERAPDKNLRYLRLKFHTIYVPEDSMEGIRKLRGLYDKVLQATQKSHDAWVAVCVVMLSSPEFFAY